MKARQDHNWFALVLLLIAGSSAVDYQSCQDVYFQLVTPEDGVYSINGTEAFCQFDSDIGTGFQLMTHFAVNNSVQISSDKGGYNPNIPWTHGFGNVPTNPYNISQGFTIESHDWRQFLEVGKEYYLRQQFFKKSNDSAQPLSRFDVRWKFVYNGYVDQSSAPNFAYQWWPLSNRESTADEIPGVPEWSPDDVRPEYFWLPFQANVTKPYMTPLGNCFSISDDIISNMAGSAGVVKFNQNYDQDPECLFTGANWAPNLNGSELIWAYDGTYWGIPKYQTYDVLNYWIAKTGYDGDFVAPEIVASPGASVRCFGAPQPVSEWNFEDGTCRDAYGTADGTLIGDAYIEAGQLVLSGYGYMESQFLQKNISPNKTLEVGLYLDSTFQHGGSPVSLFNTVTGDFDALVYGQVQAFTWFPYSNNDERIPTMGPRSQTELDGDVNQLVKLTFVQVENVGMSIYRNGQEIESAPTNGTFILYPGDKSKIFLGIMGTNSQVSQGFISARIEYARLYDFALTESQVRLTHAFQDEYSAPCLQDSRILYISPSGSGDGNDQANPTNLYRLVNSRRVIAPGTAILFMYTDSFHSYMGTWKLPSNVTLEGNFDRYWRKIPTASQTQISFFPEHLSVPHPNQPGSVTSQWMGIDLSNVHHVTIRDLVINNGGLPSRRQVENVGHTLYGIRIENCTNIRIERVQFASVVAGDANPAVDLTQVAVSGMNGSNAQNFTGGAAGNALFPGGYSGGRGAMTGEGSGEKGRSFIPAGTPAGTTPLPCIDTACRPIIGGACPTRFRGDDGGNGTSGDNGNPGISYFSNAEAFISNYYFPTAGRNGTAGAAGSGGGGGGAGGDPPGSTNLGGGGGGGGAGGQGGGGGGGGFGGGGNFGIFVSGCQGCVYTDVFDYDVYDDSLTSTLGMGGQPSDGMDGSEGGDGGYGGLGALGNSPAPCSNFGGSGGFGGKGGRGGNGGKGEDGSLSMSTLLYPNSTIQATGYLNSSNLGYWKANSTFCTNSIISLKSVGTPPRIWGNLTSGRFIRDLTPATSNSSASAVEVGIFYDQIGNYPVQLENVTHTNVINIYTDRDLPAVSTPAVFSGNLSVTITRKFEDRLFQVEIFNSTFSSLVRTDWIYFYQDSTTLQLSVPQPSDIMWLRLYTFGIRCGKSIPMWISFNLKRDLSLDLQDLCFQFFRSVSEFCQSAGKSLLINTSPVIQHEINMSPVTDVEILGNLTLTSAATVKYTAGSPSNGSRDLTGGVIRISGILFAGGRIDVILPETLTAGIYTIDLFTFNSIVGDFNLNAYFPGKKRQDSNCGNAEISETPGERKNGRYGATIRVITPCGNEIDSSSGDLGTVVGAAVGALGGVLLLAGILGIVILVVRRRRRRGSGDFDEFLMKPMLLQDVHVEKQIGAGAFGEVYKGTWGHNEVAMKKTKDGDDEDFLQELSTLTKITHPNVVQYYGMAEIKSEKYIVMEFVKLGSLKSGIQKFNLNLRNLLDMALQCSAGMIHLEEKGIIHRDLALRNVLFAQTGEKSFICKIADFGMSRKIETENYSSTGNKFPLKWCPPEVLEYHTFSVSSDVWAFGVLLWELFSDGADPYGDLNSQETAAAVINGRRLVPPNHLPKEVQEMMKMTWADDPNRRPKFGEINFKLKEARDATNEDAAKVNVMVHADATPSDVYGKTPSVYPMYVTPVQMESRQMDQEEIYSGQ